MNIFSEYLDIFGVTGRAIQAVWWIVLPVAFFILFRYVWGDYAEKRYFSKLQFVLLEIIPPRDVEKSPKIMEPVFEALNGANASTTVLDERLGGDPGTSIFSFELVSIEGSVHMFVFTERRWRNLIEANLYAYYPDLEIREVPEYTTAVPKVIPNKEWNLWGCDFELTAPDPIPIRTYKRFEEMVTGKMLDPLSSVIEALGKVGPGQQSWFQIVVMPIKDQEKKWLAEGRAEIDKIARRTKPSSPSVFGMLIKDISDIISNIPRSLFGVVEFAGANENGEKEQPLLFRLTPGEQDRLKAIEANLEKPGYNVKMRFLYLGKRDQYDGTNIGGFIGSLRQFSDQSLNGFKPEDASKTYAWFFLRKSRMAFRQRKIFARYRDRDMRGKKAKFSSEELATLFHMPDMSVMAPSLKRIEARTGGAPSNLPI